jgi:DNA-binding transcriptional regulator YhcF (GntR family)
MSFEALAWAWKQKTGSSGRKATLSALAQFADEHGHCFPSQAHIAEYTEQSERTVREHLAFLEKNGFISRVGRARQDGTKTTDFVSLNLSKPPAGFATGYKAKNQRKISPPAEFATGEKPQNPPAKIAAQEPVTNPSDPVIKKHNAPGKPVRTDFLAVLLADGVAEQVAKDFLSIRKAKRAPLTQTALDAIAREASKANLTLADAIQICTERSWQGFNASWLMAKSVGSESTQQRDYGQSGRLQ